jgi:hypothetical protein
MAAIASSGAGSAIGSEPVHQSALYLSIVGLRELTPKRAPFQANPGPHGLERLRELLGGRKPPCMIAVVGP